MTKRNRYIFIWLITFFIGSIIFLFFSQYYKTSKNNPNRPIEIEQKPEFTTELSKNNTEKKEIPSIRRVDKPYYMKIKLTINKDNTQETSYIDFYRKDNKLKLIYKNDDKDSIMAQWPFPGTVLKEIYEIGDKMYSCVEFNDKLECIYDEGIGAMEIFDFEGLLSLAKSFSDKTEKEVNWEKVECYSNPNLNVSNTTCIFKDKNIIQLSENKNKNYGIKIETLEYKLEVDDNEFNFNHSTISTQDFFNKHSDYLIPLMEKEEKIKNWEVKTTNDINVPVPIKK